MEKVEQDKTKLCQWLKALMEPSEEDGEVIRSYLDGHSLPELLWEYPTLGISVNAERKLETMTQLISYNGREVPWR